MQALQTAQSCLIKLRSLPAGDITAFPLLNEVQRLALQQQEALARQTGGLPAQLQQRQLQQQQQQQALQQRSMPQQNGQNGAGPSRPPAGTPPLSTGAARPAPFGFFQALTRDSPLRPNGNGTAQSGVSAPPLTLAAAAAAQRKAMASSAATPTFSPERQQQQQQGISAFGRSAPAAAPAAAHGDQGQRLSPQARQQPPSSAKTGRFQPPPAPPPAVPVTSEMDMFR
ncbi:MAG: hypothetical protein WDW36_010292 [Sanguina aurantia]